MLNSSITLSKNDRAPGQFLAREKAPKRVPKKHSRFGIILHAAGVWKQLVFTLHLARASVFYDE